METKREINRVELQRHQAIIRHPDYKRAYDRLRELEGDKEWRELIEVFIQKVLQYQLNIKKLKGSKKKDRREQLDMALQMDHKDHMKKLDELRKKVRETARAMERNALRQDMIEKWGGPLPFPGDENLIYPSAYSHWLIVNPRWQKGVKLNLTIDLRPTESEIIKSVKKIIKNYKSTPKDRNRERIFDPFLIYDMHKVEKLSFVDIARLLANVDGKTKSADPILRAYAKQIERGYKNAVKMIKESSLRSSE